MAVIKANIPQPTLTPFLIRDMETAAQSLLLRARRAAEQLLIEAQREADVLKQQSRSEGFAQGREEGFAKGNEEGRRTGHQAALAEIKPQLTATWTALTTAVQQLDAARYELESAGIKEVIELATAIARKVTKREAQIDPAVLMENVQGAMKLAVQAADVRIVIHPSQRKTMTEELPRLQMNWPNLKHVELVDDPAISPGGCRLLTQRGEVDARIDEQLDRVIRELLPEPQ
jgi:flagellar biosynthesis/type III secretory pathway protein FliH